MVPVNGMPMRCDPEKRVEQGGHHEYHDQVLRAKKLTHLKSTPTSYVRARDVLLAWRVGGLGCDICMYPCLRLHLHGHVERVDGTAAEAARRRAELLKSAQP